MTENEFILYDRIDKIQQIMTREHSKWNFYIAFSGGKDSCVLDALIDMAIPDNELWRVYVDTGIDYNDMREFVYNKAKTDERVQIIKPQVPIKQTLDTYGYPFKSKRHSRMVEQYQRSGVVNQGIQNYIDKSDHEFGCPKKLAYQFTEDTPSFPISKKCCEYMKEKPMEEFARQHHLQYCVLGITQDEGDTRKDAQCLSFRNGRLKNFQPLAPVSKEWEDWFIEEFNIPMCKLYYPPFNFKRTGCKGCPFALELQRQLDLMEHYMPNERAQCERIWKPVYDEYRRLNYRLKR